jgi:hypothetical protein
MVTATAKLWLPVGLGRATSTVAKKSMTPQMSRKTWVAGSGRQSGTVKKYGHDQIDYGGQVKKDVATDTCEAPEPKR